jgi:hypothetical protein
MSMHTTFCRARRSGRWLWLAVLAVAASTSSAYVLFEGDGSDEPGFVAPLAGPPPPPPPANISSGESYIPYPGPPAAPLARSEKKNPPTPPIMFTKIRSQFAMVDWAARPNDLNNLLKNMKGMIDVDFASEVKSLDEIDTNPERNPILYRSGHFHFTLTTAQRARLREYLLNGGMLILNPGMGSKPFFDSARKELQEMFPEVPVQRLSSDHPIFHSYYDLSRVDYRRGVRDAGYKDNDPWLEGITINCRTVAVISRWGLDIGWDALDDDSLRGYSIKSAQQIGVNLLSYATAQQAWARQAAHAMQFVDADTASAGKMFIAQVKYDGVWKTRHAGVSVLLHQFNQKTAIPVKYAVRELRLSDPAIFDAPLLYITGHEDFTLKPEEIAALRQYLAKGGMLFAEACCGRKAFDVAFRRELAKVLPGETLATVAGDDPLLAMPNRVAHVGTTPALAAQLGNKSSIEPRLLGVNMDGHYTVLYSPYGMSGGWELSQNPYAFGYDDAGAIGLGENILMYGITQ